MAYFPTALTRVFRKLCLLCDFFIHEKKSSLNTLRDDWTSSKLRECQYPDAQSHYMTGQEWNLFHGKIVRSTIFWRKTIALSLGCTVVTFTHKKLTEFWQNSELTRVKPSFILPSTLPSTLPLCWGTLIAAIALAVSHSMDLHYPDVGKHSGKTPFVLPPHLVSSTGT